MEDIDAFRARFAQALVSIGAVGCPLSFVSVVCNGCGECASASSVDGLIEKLDGWRISDEYGGIDLCPRCAST